MRISRAPTLLVLTCLFAIVLCSPGPEIFAQQPTCTVPVNVIGPDLSSLSKDQAEDRTAAWLQQWGNQHPYPWGGALGSKPLWAPVRDVPADAFVVRDKKHPVPVESVTVDRGPRRIVFVADNGAKMTLAARKIEAAVIANVLSKGRAEDSFALLTARGPRMALPFGAGLDSMKAPADKLSGLAQGQGKGESVLDAVLEATSWLQPPKAGDSILLVAMRVEGGNRVSSRKVRNALRAGGIRLFGFQLGPSFVVNKNLEEPALYSGFIHGMLTLAKISGGVVVVEDTEESNYRLDTEDLDLLKTNAEQMYSAIVQYYVLRFDSIDPHQIVRLYPVFKKQPHIPLRVLYPHYSPNCVSAAAVKPFAIQGGK
jgi:hypothetical protein